MRRTAALCLLLAPLLAGCFTVRRSKAIAITPEPGATVITVAADAVAKCTDLILVTVCRLDLDLKRVGGLSPNSPQAKKVREFIAARYDLIVAQLAEGRGPDLESLLDLLQTPPAQRVEAVLRLKEFNLRTKGSVPAFSALVVDNLLKAS